MATIVAALALGVAALAGAWALLATSDALVGRRGPDRLAHRFLYRALIGDDDAADVRDSTHPPL